MKSGTSPAQDPRVRQSGCGGSDAAVIMRASPWKTPYALYLEKIGEVDQEEIGHLPWVRWGTILEDPIADEFAEVTGKRVQRVNRTLRHPEHEFMMAHLDRRVVGEKVPLECKTAGFFVADSWGPDGGSEIPEHYRWQVDHYMAVLGSEYAYLAVLIGGSDFRWYTIQRDEDRIRRLVEAEREFWDGVQTGTPPPIQNEADADRKHPLDTEPLATASSEDIEIFESLVGVERQIKALERERTHLRAALKEATGDAAELRTPDGQIVLASWKSHERKSFDSRQFKQDYPDLYEDYVKTTSQRPFRPNMEAFNG